VVSGQWPVVRVGCQLLVVSCLQLATRNLHSAFILPSALILLPLRILHYWSYLMADKFIPNGDMDFVMMAEKFARTIANEPARFTVTQADSDALSEAVVRYRTALNAARSGASRSPRTTRAKDSAREDAERHIRRLAHVIRVSEGVDSVAKASLNLRQRPAKAKTRKCPQQPPRLRFVRAQHEGGGATPLHELEFSEFETFSSAKPPGAVRVELFVDLISPEEPIPAWPGANHGGRPWYLRSFTRNPIVIVPPLSRLPMRVVYWARWADSTGNVGPFSATAVGWIEGGTHHMRLAPALGGAKSVPLLEDAAAPGPVGRDPTYSVAVLDAQYECLNPQDAALPSLPAPANAEPEPRRLEGPQASEAA